MKRIISLLFALVIMMSITTTSVAANTGEEYYTVQVEYSDNIGHQEGLDVMIQNNNVFVDAKMLAERLGYTFGENGEGAVIYNKDRTNGLPFGITQFKYNSTQVSHMLFNNMIDTYEAPFASVKNSEGSWIPLEYSLLLINSGMMITDDALLIDIPTKRIIDYFYDIAKNSAMYNFDWADDFGYTETDMKVLGGSSHLINVFNGLLRFDGASWTTLFQQFSGSMASYDKKYGENLAMLLCTESDKELQATIDKVDMLIDVLDEDGKLGQMLSSTSTMLDSQVGTLYENCEDILQKVKSGNSPLISYNKSYQALEDAMDRQTWFSNTGGNILEVQKGVSSAVGKAFTFLEVGMKVAEVVGYTQEFQNQDNFSLAALTYYLDTEDSGLELPEAMKKSMIDYSDTLSCSIGEYTTKRFAENVDQWIIDEIPIHEVLGTQAAAVLFAWNIASNTIPFIANGLSGADSFELALYSLVFQGDTYLNYLSKRDSVFADAGNITAENVYDIAQYCYIYLKSCYVTREAALASLANKSSSTKEKIQPLIDYQNRINSEIAKIMVELKGSNKTNNGCVFGFLPSNNEDYLDKYDDNLLAQWIRTPKPSALSEEELLTIMQNNSGHQMDKHVFVDMDRDGLNELIGVYADNRDWLHRTWYCSSDGEICKLVHTGSEPMDEYNIELISLENETHLAMNGYRMMGTFKQYSILALHDKEIECEVLNHYGYVNMSDGGDILLDVEAYDGYYDPTINGMIGHTWKDTYLYYDGYDYKEYGAIQISEEAFLSFENAQGIIDLISSELTTSDTSRIEYSYFKRKNGIIHIQCNEHQNSGGINYGYYTIRYSNSTLDTDTVTYFSGQMSPSFSQLDVTY